MDTYLDKIVAWHRQRAHDSGFHDDSVIDALRTKALTAHLEYPETALGQRLRRGFANALRSPGLSVIAEIKRRSPSKGALDSTLDPAEVARLYEVGGAAALSVLTDEAHFGGSVNDLQAARSAVSLPVIRKDFTVCPADVWEAGLMGADCILLIVAVLSDAELASCSGAAEELGLDVLWETHDEHEVERALPHAPKIIGVNQRDLHSFQVDQERAVRVVAAIPDEVVKVAESGVRGPDDAFVLHQAGYDAVLVGESLIRSDDRAASVRALVASGSQREG